MSDVLDTITARTRETVVASKATTPEADLTRLAADQPPPRGFRRALNATLKSGRHALIAEIKKASPSRGLIRADFDPATLARAYRDGGATCLSVLTDGPFFQGRLPDLVAARAAVDLPAIRKDFMIDPYQVIEARAHGADCILVIMAALDDGLAAELVDAATALGMDSLIEVHNEEELERALSLGAPFIGINNRNLKTLKVNLQTTIDLSARVPAGTELVAESGLKGLADLDRMAAAGAGRFLVGEHLMSQPDVAAATRTLLGLDAAAA